MAFSDLNREAKKLSTNERIELAYSLLESIDDQEDPEHERLWIEEIERRCREIDEGKVELIPGEQVLAEIRAKLANMQGAPAIREDIKTARSFQEIERDALQLPLDEGLDLAYAILRDLEDEGLKVNWERPELIGRSRASRTASNEIP
ncbi:MAG: addiction module protein [Thermoanaerobaculia bacterium]